MPDISDLKIAFKHSITSGRDDGSDFGAEPGMAIPFVVGAGGSPAAG
jgi:hypothetical protein